MGLNELKWDRPLKLVYIFQCLSILFQSYIFISPPSLNVKNVVKRHGEAVEEPVRLLLLFNVIVLVKQSKKPLRDENTERV